MKFLLDTHAWLWALQDPRKLNAQARRHIEKRTNELWLSPISVWEAALLYERKRIRTTLSFERWLSEAQRELPLSEAALTTAVAAATRRIAIEHEDPADRFIAATAHIFDLTLLTADARLLRGRGFTSIDCG